MAKSILSPTQQNIHFPISISYPAERPWAGHHVVKSGDRVIITYFSARELRAALELHKMAQQLEREVTR